ncbi:prefoldin subunit, partial [Ancylostoma duodenale]
MLEERYKKYKYVEASMTSQKTRMAEKLPDFKHSLAILDVLIDKKVSIWLGANVMVEYELDKAKELLEKNRGNVQKAVDELASELAFVKDQITTTEVNIAHVHNYGVKK